MYTKLELVFIFTSAKTFDELEEICQTFQWLIDQEFEQKSKFLNTISHIAFRKLNNC